MASTLSTTYVNGLYTNLIGFTDPAGAAAWAAQIDLGTSPYNVANAFLDVYQQSGAPVALLYQAAFGRVPDYDGYAYWLNNFKTVSAGDPLLLSQQFYASTEFANRIGGDPTNLTESAYVNALYLNVLGRPGDPSGATYWTDWLTAQETALGGTDTAKDTARNQLLDIFAMSGENVSEHGKQIETFTVFAGFDNRAPTTAEFTAAETQAELTTVTGVVGASPNFGTTGPAPVPIFALSLAADPASVVEGSASTFTVTTNVPTLAALDYNISVVGDTLGGTAGAASSNDFGTLPTTVKVTTGASTATFAITPVADNITEGPEGFKVTLLNGATPVVSTTALITDLVDSTPPVVTAGQVIPYAENLVAGATVGTVAATDNVGVTGFTIASGNDKGYFAIDGTGVVTLTAAGAAAGSAAETSTIQPNQFVLGVTASDAAGNVSTAANVTLNVLDTTAPVATAAAIGASGSSLVMAFNEALVTSKLPLPTDFAVVQNGSTAVAVSTVTINGSSVTLGLGSSVSGTVTVSYTPNTDPAKDLQDAAGNSVAAITNKSVVVDTIAPTLSGSVPADGATDVAVGANIVLNMSETVKAGTGNIVLTNSNDPTDTRTISVADATQVSFSGVAVTINPTVDLKTGGAYVVTMNSGVIVDLVGNAFAGLSGTQLDFTTPGGGSTPGQTFPLTNSIDNVVGTAGDDIIIAGSQAGLATLNAGDLINGGLGTDRLNIFNSGTVAGKNEVLNGANFTIATISSVEQVFFQASETAQVLDVSGNSGVTQAWASQGFDSNITVALSQTVGITGDVDASAAAQTFTFKAAAGLADSATLAATSADLTKVTGGKGVKIKDVETLNIVATGTNKFGGFDSDAKTLVISGAGSLNMGALAASVVTKIDASLNSGGFVIDNSSAVAANETVTGSSGNDIYTTKYANLNQSDVINLGAGTDSLRFADAATFTTSAQKAFLTNVSGVEQLGTVDAALTIDGNFVSQTSYYTDGAAGAFVLTNIANSASVTFGAGVILASTAAMALTPTPTLNVNLAGTTVAAADVTTGLTVTGSSTINVNSTGTAGVANNVLALTAADNQSVVVTGAQNLTLTTTAATGTTGFSIDGSAFTGKLTVTGTAATDVVKGGSGADTISGGAGAAIADTLTGNGGADKFTIIAGATSTTFDTVTDFVTKSDTITFAGAAGSATNYSEATAAVSDFTAALAAANIALDTTVLYNAQQIGSDTYVFSDIGATGSATTVVKLTGVALTGIEFADIVA